MFFYIIIYVCSPSNPVRLVQLLHDLSISAKDSDGVKLLKVIKNPVTDYLPTGCLKIGAAAAFAPYICQLYLICTVLQAPRSRLRIVSVRANSSRHVPRTAQSRLWWAPSPKASAGPSTATSK